MGMMKVSMSGLFTLAAILSAAVLYSVNIGLQEFVDVTVRNGKGNLECTLATVGIFKSTYYPNCDFFQLPGSEVEGKTTEFWPLNPAQHEFGQVMEPFGVTFDNFTTCKESMPAYVSQLGTALNISKLIDTSSLLVGLLPIIIKALVDPSLNFPPQGTQLDDISDVYLPPDLNGEVNVRAAGYSTGYNPQRISEMYQVIFVEIGLKTNLTLLDPNQDLTSVNSFLAEYPALTESTNVLFKELRTTWKNKTIAEVLDPENGPFVEALNNAQFQTDAMIFSQGFPNLDTFLSAFQSALATLPDVFGPKQNPLWLDNKSQLLGGTAVAYWRYWIQQCSDFDVAITNMTKCTMETPGVINLLNPSKPLDHPGSFGLVGAFDFNVQTNATTRDALTIMANSFANHTFGASLAAGVLQGLLGQLGRSDVFETVGDIFALLSPQLAPGGYVSPLYSLFDKLGTAASLALDNDIPAAAVVPLLFQALSPALSERLGEKDMKVLATIVDAACTSLGELPLSMLLARIVRTMAEAPSDNNLQDAFKYGMNNSVQEILGAPVFTLLYPGFEWSLDKDSAFDVQKMTNDLIGQCQDTETSIDAIQIATSLGIVTVVLMWIALICATVIETNSSGTFRDEKGHLGKKSLGVLLLLTTAAAAVTSGALLNVQQTPVYKTLTSGACPVNAPCYKLSSSFGIAIAAVVLNILVCTAYLVQVIQGYRSAKSNDVEPEPEVKSGTTDSSPQTEAQV